MKPGSDVLWIFKKIHWNLAFVPHKGERIVFSEQNTADGAIALFEKLMHYESGFIR